MQVHISIGENRHFKLREALLVYGDPQRIFVTRHHVTLHKDAPPTLEPAQPLTLGFVESLVRSLSGTPSAEVLPENVLARGERLLVWWTRSAGGRCSTRTPNKRLPNSTAALFRSRPWFGGARMEI
jgi:hypothetical protein